MAFENLFFIPGGLFSSFPFHLDIFYTSFILEHFLKDFPKPQSKADLPHYFYPVVPVVFHYETYIVDLRICRLVDYYCKFKDSRGYTILLIILSAATSIVPGRVGRE